MIQNIGVIGVGGVGGYFGGKLCQRQEFPGSARVSFIARGEHLRVIQAEGLRLRSESDGELVCHPALATDDFAQLPPQDLWLLCVKEFDLFSALEKLKPQVGPATIILPLLNGVDIHTRVRQVIQQGIVLPACVYVGTHIASPGVVVQKGGACRILFGPDPKRPDFVPAEIIQLFAQAGIKHTWTENIQTEIWQKFIFICAFGLVTAAFNKTLGEILGNDTLRNEVQTVMREVASLARASGADLPADIVEVSLAKGRNFPAETKTSFQRDFERPDKPDERNLFAGSMMRIAGECGIDIPKTKELARVLEEKKPTQ
jgi:2-dehydropantoate 2-reductase